MRLIENAKRDWHRLWSVRLALIAAVLDGVNACWFAFGDTLPKGYFLAAGMGFSLAACVARLIRQPRLSDGAE